MQLVTFNKTLFATFWTNFVAVARTEQSLYEAQLRNTFENNNKNWSTLSKHNS